MIYHGYPIDNGLYDPTGETPERNVDEPEVDDDEARRQREYDRADEWLDAKRDRETERELGIGD